MFARLYQTVSCRHPRQPLAASISLCEIENSADTLFVRHFCLDSALIKQHGQFSSVCRLLSRTERRNRDVCQTLSGSGTLIRGPGSLN